MTISEITLRRLRLLLSSPYRLSYRTFTEFEPYVVEIGDTEGRRGIADAHISPGSSSETREGGWSHLTDRLPHLLGRETVDAKAALRADFDLSKVATTAAVVALELLEQSALATVEDPADLPLLVPVGAQTPEQIEIDVEAAIEAGYRTLKVKVGKDVDDDLDRLAVIQSAAAGRAQLRVDANRAYSRDDAIAFVRRADPTSVVLFEQPCEADRWDDNAAVAAASDIPVMLDEPICTLSDIERAAGIDGVRFCKVKLKRFGGLQALADGIEAIQAHGMEAVLGDGLGSDLHNWLEASVAARLIDNAGEFNGFLKMTDRILTEPLTVKSATLRLAAGGCPEISRNRLDASTIERVDFN